MPSSPVAQQQPPMSNTGLSPQLASLASATEPKNTTSNQYQSSVATFPQRPIGAGTTTAPQPPDTKSPFGDTFNIGSNTGLSFVNSSLKDKSDFNFSNSTQGSAPFIFRGPAANSEPQQAMPSFTYTPSKQQETLNDRLTAPLFSPTTNTIFSTPVSTGTQPTTTSAVPRQPSSSASNVVQKTNSPKDEQEQTEAPLSLAEMSLLEKKINTKLRDSGSVVLDRSDPSSPLHSLKSFEELNLKPELLKGIYEMGFRSPSRIQETALPYLLANPPRNIIAQSQSGTGKTAAFALAILSRIDPSIKTVQALVLSPTFELALQIGSVIEQMAKFLPFIRIAYAVRNSQTNRVRNQLLAEPIVIGTPGTVEDWCRKIKVIDLTKLRVCCVDEADVMIATQGFQDMCVNLVRSLDHNRCQMMLFSATYSDEVMNFARQIVPQPIVARLKREKQTLNNIRQFFIKCYTLEEKFYAIQQIYIHLVVGQAMIFCRTKATARALAVKMASDGHSVRELTAALDIEQRASVIRQFREHIFNVLISTNVTARGIDIDEVSLVVNYDMPVTIDFGPDYETYLHRIGRCGRFGKLGYTFNLISSEKEFNIMKDIENYFSHPIQEITIQEICNLEPDQT